LLPPLLAALLAAQAPAQRIHAPPPGYADAESSAHQALAQGRPRHAGVMRVELRFDAGAGGAEVALGRAGGDGRLSLAGTRVILGAAGGGLFLRGDRLRRRIEAPDPAPGAAGARTLTALVSLGRGGAAQAVTFSADGAGAAFGGMAPDDPFLLGLFDPAGLDAFRVTARGAGGVSARVSFEAPGTTLILR
jgi:hypothetical protein